MKVLIDSPHGFDTSGKHSPDGRIYEWRYSRKLSLAISNRLKASGIDAVRFVPEDYDVSLKERCRRVNAIAANEQCLLISPHLNASPPTDGQWHTGRGFIAIVSPNSSRNSKQFAKMLFDEAEKRNLKGNRWWPKERYVVKNLAILRETICPAVLTENLFQDNLADVDYLLTDDGFNAIVDLHVTAIKRYVTTYG